MRAAIFALVALSLLAVPARSHAQQTRGLPGSASKPAVIAQSIAVPVFPGQMVAATVMLPAQGETPLPAVLLLTVRVPGSAPVQAAYALAEALLARGIAVVQLELPPVEPDATGGGEPLAQPADDAFAVLQFVREREDIDGDRVALAGVGEAAEHAARASGLDEGVRALVLLGARPVARDSMNLPTALPVMALPLEMRAAPAHGQSAPSPAIDAAAFLSRHLQ